MHVPSDVRFQLLYKYKLIETSWMAYITRRLNTELDVPATRSRYHGLFCENRYNDIISFSFRKTLISRYNTIQILLLPLVTSSYPSHRWHRRDRGNMLSYEGHYHIRYMTSKTQDGDWDGCYDWVMESPLYSQSDNGVCSHGILTLKWMHVIVTYDTSWRHWSSRKW